MLRAYPAARWLAGTTLAVTVLHGPRTDARKTIAKKRRTSDVVRSGSRMASVPSGTAATTAALAMSR